MEIQSITISNEDRQLISTFYGEDLGNEIDFNRLMPVVEKISKHYDVSIRWYAGDCSCWINKQTLEGVEICSYGNFEPSIVNAYKAVVEFIKWHNTQKQ
jgi:hypothetical protein